MVSVASPGLAAAYKGRAIDVRTVSRELNVRYVIEGEIRPDAERDVVNTHLVDAGTGVQLWGDQNEIPKAATREERDVLVLRSARRLRNASVRRAKQGLESVGGDERCSSGRTRSITHRARASSTRSTSTMRRFDCSRTSR